MVTHLIKLHFILFIISHLVHSYLYQNLNGQWQIEDSKGKYNISGDVPGGIYTALIKNNIIGDPFYRDNDIKYRWIALENWTYSRNFDISIGDLKLYNIHLVAEGLDTFASLSINGMTLGSTDNMFIKYIFDIRNLLQEGKNTITIDFTSAVTMAEYLNNQSAYSLPSICPPEYHGFCHYNFIRKFEYSFSWDWGPAFPSQGIWKNIYIEKFLLPKLNSISVLPLKIGDEWSIEVDVYIDVPGEITISGEITTILEGTTLPKHVQTINITPYPQNYHYEILIPKDVEIGLWWPTGYGDQTVYTVSVILSIINTTETSNKSKTIGFRTVELVQDPVSDSYNFGASFYFRVNGVPIFLKGANWVPPDMFLERITEERISILLQSVVEANMNVLTIPGLAVYEADYFYEMTNRLGIMLIEGLMFCDAVYPTTKPFLGSVTTEVTQQVRRLKNHPSIIAWGFNDEDEVLISENWLNLTNIEIYKQDYIKLFIDTIRPIVVSEDTTRPWIPSSPSDGIYTKDNHWIANDCQSELYGDVHFYDYSSDMWNVTSYPTPRFASEYGLISWCEYETLETVLKDSDMDLFSDMCIHRTHHPQGAQQMYDECKSHMALPNSSDTVQNFKDMIYVTQINHALMMRFQTEHFRRSQNHLDLVDGKGNTMGAIFWFLADVWQAPTWSSIDFNLKWKMLHYYAKRFFSPTIISPYLEGENLHIYIVNDELPSIEERHSTTNRLQFRPMTPLEIVKKFPSNRIEDILMKTEQAIHGNVTMEMYNWATFTPLKTWNIPFKLNHTTGSVFQRPINEVQSDAGCVQNKSCFLYFYLNSKSNPTSTSWLPLTYFTHTHGVILKANIQIKNVIATSATKFTINLATNNIAPFVWINAYNISGRFSDNGFLMKDPTLHLTFTAWQPVGLDTFNKSLTVKSLMDIYK
ncbi:hypothetical protein SNE40_009315 [Patella caerulea]|uniref:beta-mannosidase n=1 Tax=Patella caerulea TaxID=87958 RepID=A0AAN8JNN3_PATCE